MFGWLQSIVSSGASKIIDSVGTAVDKCVTSDEERLTLKNALVAEVNKHKEDMLKEAHSYEISIEQNITDRWKADASSDSWMSKNIRPMVMAFLTIVVSLLAYLTIFILPPDKVKLINPWIDLYKMLMMVVYGGYFGFRSWEKVTSMKTKFNGNKEEQ